MNDDDTTVPFTVACCGTRRGLLPGGVLICPTCDYSHEGASVIPHERLARDVPDGVEVWSPWLGEP